MADGGMVKADAAPIMQALRGELKFTDGKVLVPIAKGAAAGALGVTLTRYFGNDWFPQYEEDDDGNPTTTEDKNYKLKRGGFKIVAGVGGAMMLRKVSQAAAIGWLGGCTADGVADIIEDKATEYLDDWFGDEEETTDAPAEEQASGAVNYFQRVSRRR